MTNCEKKNITFVQSVIELNLVIQLVKFSRHPVQTGPAVRSRLLEKLGPHLSDLLEKPNIICAKFGLPLLLTIPIWTIPPIFISFFGP